MKANDFVKKFGIEYTATICKMSANANVSFEDNFVHVDDLKHLVESHELVELRGGLSEAKAIEQQYWNSGVGSAIIVSMELKQAILDVESCQ